MDDGSLPGVAASTYGRLPAARLAARGECPNTPSRITFSDNGNALAACGQFPGQSRLWRITHSEANGGQATLEAVRLDPDTREPLALSPSGESIAFCRSDSVCVRHLADDAPYRTAAFPNALGKGSVAFLDEDRLVVVAGRLHDWDLTNDRISLSPVPSKAPIAPSPDRKLVLCRRQLLRGDNLRPVFQFPTWVNSVASVDWSRNGRRLALGLEGGDVAVWDLPTVVARLDVHGLPREEIAFGSASPVEAIDKMIEIGRRGADALHPDQWLYRCELLKGWLENDVLDPSDLIRRVRTLSEEMRRIGDRPFFTRTDSEDRWPEIARAGQGLAQRLQEGEHYDAQLVLLRAMVSGVETLRPESPEGLRQASMIHHSLGDLLNFFRPDGEACLQAYAEEQHLLDRLGRHPDQPRLARTSPAGCFGYDRNRALAHARIGDREVAIETMDRAVSTFEQFPGDYVDVPTLARAYDSLISWLNDGGRAAAADLVRRRKADSIR